MRFLLIGCVCLAAAAQDGPFQVSEDGEQIRIFGFEHLGGRAQARVCERRGGRIVRGQEDRLPRCGFRTGHRGLAHGAGQRRGVSGQLPDGTGVRVRQRVSRQARRSAAIEGPQICTKAKELSPRVIRRQGLRGGAHELPLQDRGAGQEDGSEWTQTIVFPAGKRYFISSDRITTVNSSEGMFLRIDMPGHIKHHGGDTFSEVYLSYKGKIPASEFCGRFRAGRKVSLHARGEPGAAGG